MISGGGAVEQIGTGTTVLEADNSYRGGTTIAAGALQLGDGGTSGSILGDVVNNGKLVFNRSDVLTFDGAISGSGGVDQIGTGTTILTADNSQLTGTSTVNAGILSVNGVLGGTLVVHGGRLQGTGTVGTINNEAGGVPSHPATRSAHSLLMETTKVKAACWR